MDQDRWHKLSLMEQLANIGSEINRAMHWQEINDRESQKKALSRALDLINLTIAYWQSHFRIKELSRLKEVVCAMFIGRNEYLISLDTLRDYFLAFALAVRRGR